MLAVKAADPKVIAPPRRLVGILPEEGEVEIPNPNTACVWHYSQEDKNKDNDLTFDEQMHRTIGTCAIKDDICYIADFSGLFHAFDAKTGKELWNYDMLGPSWGSPLIADDKVIFGDEDGDLFIFEHSRQKKMISAVERKPDDPEDKPDETKIHMVNAIYSTPIYANGVLFIANKSYVFAIAEGAGEVAAKTDK
jgi:outer membrane protein assembly factor BamB